MRIFSVIPFYFFEESISSIVALKLAYGTAPDNFFVAFTLPSASIKPKRNAGVPVIPAF